MRLLRKTVIRLFLASLILALPQVALASSGGQAESDDHWLYGIIDGMSGEAVESLALVFSMGGCFGPDEY